MPSLSLGLGLHKNRVFSASGGLPFSPSDIPNLSLWLKSDAGVSLSGSFVTAWADQSGNGNNTTDYGGYSPTFVTNVVNGKPVIRFGNGGDLTVLKTAPSSIGNTGNLTVIGVYKYNDSGNVWAEVVAKTDLASESNSQFSLTAQFINGDNGWTNAFGAMDISDGFNWDWSSTETSYANQWIIHEGISDVTNEYQAMYINGDEVSASLSVSQINAVNIEIGIGNAGSDREPLSPEYGGFQGDIAEILIYDRAITISERQQVEAYLNTKYAIYN
jgi:hypothetical protein